MKDEDDFEGIRKIAHPSISHELLDIICMEKEGSDEQKKEIVKISMAILVT